MKRLIITFALASVLSGCATLNPFQGVTSPPSAPKKMGSWSQSETVRPLIVGKVGENVVVANETTRTYQASAEEALSKPSLWGKIKALGWGWAILMVLGLFFPPIAAIMGVVNRALGFGVRKIVSGVQNGLDKIEDGKSYTGAEVKAMFKTELSKTYDDGTKKLVEEIKAKGIPS